MIRTDGRPTIANCGQLPEPQAEPKFVDAAEIRAAAKAFVAALGTENRKLLEENLALTCTVSDALAALKAAL